MFQPLLLLAAAAFGLGAAALGEEVTVQGRTFMVPDGMELQAAVKPGLVAKPLAAAFDDVGMLYVAEAQRLPGAADGAPTSPAFRILQLRDADGDGVFERSTTFADDLPAMTGLLWLNGILYVGTPAGVLKVSDLRGEGRSDRREGWPPAETAEIESGPYLGPEGWIYWAQQGERNAGSKPAEESVLCRCAPDSDEKEIVATAAPGSVRGVSFTPEGETVAALEERAAAGQAPGWAHAIYGGALSSSPPSGLLPRTGRSLPLEPATSAPRSMLRYQGYTLGREYHGRFVSCLPSEHSVVSLALKPQGASFTLQAEPLLSCRDSSFSPAGVLEDADGSVLIFDGALETLGKSSPPHSFLRLRRAGLEAPAEPWRQLEAPAFINPMELAVMLTDPRPAVVMQATARLRRIGPAALRAVTEGLPEWPVPQIRQNVLWCLAGIESPPAQEAVRKELASGEAHVRQTAAKICGLLRDREAVEDLLPLLAGGRSAPAMVRTAAEALGRIGDPRSVPALLESAPGPEDPFLEHAFVYALLEIGDARALAAALASPRSSSRRAALLALGALPGAAGVAEQLPGWLASPDPVLKETAQTLQERHPEWRAPSTQ